MRGLALFLALLACLCPVLAMAEADDFLYDAPEAAVGTESDDSPWYYQSKELTVTVHRRHSAQYQYVLADVLSRGGLYYSGFANGKPEPDGPQQPSRMARYYGAVLGITGDYLIYDFNPRGAMIRGGRVYEDKDNGDTLAVLPDGTLRAYYSGTVRAQQLLDLGVKDSFTFGPILILDGQPNEAALTHYLAESSKRCTLAQVAPGHTMALATTNGLDNGQQQKLWMTLGVDMAYAMDGGHSSALVFMGEQLNKYTDASLLQEQRPLADMVLIGKSALVPGPDDPIRYFLTHRGR